jgi:hypothetical protein
MRINQSIRVCVHAAGQQQTAAPVNPGDMALRRAISTAARQRQRRRTRIRTTAGSDGGSTSRSRSRVGPAATHLDSVQDRASADALARRLGAGADRPVVALDPRAEAAAVQQVAMQVRSWLQRELQQFLGPLSSEAVLLPGAGAHMADDALAVSDCDFVILHGPSLMDGSIWAGRDGFLAYLRGRPCVHEPRRVTFRDVDNLQCVVIAPLNGSSSVGGVHLGVDDGDREPRGVYVRVDISRLPAAAPLADDQQRRAVGRLLRYLGDDPSTTTEGENRRHDEATRRGGSLPPLTDMPKLVDEVATRRLHSLCLNRHFQQSTSPDSRATVRLLKAVAWANGLYPSRPRHRRGVPGLGWRLMVADYLKATQRWGADESGIASAGASSVLDVCRYLQDVSNEFDGDEGGLYIAPSLGLELVDGRTDVRLRSQPVGLRAGVEAEVAQTQLARGSKLPSICMPVAWKQALHGENCAVDVCRHLNPLGWRELVQFFRVTCAHADSADSLAVFDLECAAAAHSCSLDALSFALSNCPAAAYCSHNGSAPGVLPTRLE